MSAVIGISWCEHTQNFWEGCTRVSRACDFCWAAERAGRFKTVAWDAKPRRTSLSTWHAPYLWDRKAAEAAERRRAFTISIGDFSDNQAEEEWRADAWMVIADCRNLDWLILTKRPQNITRMQRVREFPR